MTVDNALFKSIQGNKVKLLIDEPENITHSKIIYKVIFYSDLNYTIESDSLTKHPNKNYYLIKGNSDTYTDLNFTYYKENENTDGVLRFTILYNENKHATGRILI